MNSSARAPNLDAALALARIGFAVFPCRADKTPLLKDWPNRASIDETVIHGWWRQFPTAVPAIACGASGLLVVDCDRKNGKDGVAEWLRLCATNELDPAACPIIETPSGGQHYYFRQLPGPPLGNTASRIGGGIDTRGAGGYVIAPGAVLTDGRCYRVLSGTLDDIPPLHEGLHDYLASVAAGPKTDRTKTPSPSTATPALDINRERAYAQKVLAQEAEAVASAPVGSRNPTLNNAAFKIGTLLPMGGMTAAEAEAALTDAALRAGLDHNEIRATIRSGFDAGMTNPRPSLAEQDARLRQGIEIVGINRQMPMPRPTPSAPHAVPSPKRLLSRRVSDVKSEPVRWLWPKRIAIGKLTVIAGEPGLGKSQLMTYIAARVSTGTPWPGDDGRPPVGSVIMLSCEDDIADTIRPRLIAAGANVAKITVAEAVQAVAGTLRGVSLIEDLAELERLIIETVDVLLVIVDPITAYLDKIDTHKTSEVRSALAALQVLASKHGVAIVAVSHFNKNSGNGNAINAVTGSGAFVAASRATFIVTKGQEGEGLRLFLQAKGNLANAPGLAFSVVETTLPDGITAPFIEFEQGTVSVTADEALGDGSQDRKPSAVEDAKDFLREELKDGPVPATDLFVRAKEAAISIASLRRAKKALGIHIGKSGFQGQSTWGLPVIVAGDLADVLAKVQVAKMLNPANDAHNENVSTVDFAEHHWARKPKEDGNDR